MNIVKLQNRHLDDAIMLVYEFAGHTEYAQHGLVFDDVEHAVRAGIASGISYIAYDDGLAVGIILAVISPMWVNSNIKISNELAWWVSPEWRGVGMKLLQHYEQAAKEAGVTYISVVSREQQPIDALLYRKGYMKKESSWVKEN